MKRDDLAAVLERKSTLYIHMLKVFIEESSWHIPILINIYLTTKFLQFSVKKMVPFLPDGDPDLIYLNKLIQLYTKCRAFVYKTSLVTLKTKV